MSWHVRTGGSWRDVIDPQVRVAGTWRPVEAGWVRVGGTWRQFYERDTLPAPNLSDYTTLADLEVDPANAVLQIIVSIDGDFYVYRGVTNEPQNEATDWLATADKAAAGNGDYEIRLDIDSGDIPTGDSVGVWLPDTQSRTWNWIQNTVGNKQADVTLRIRNAGNAASEVSDSFSVLASVISGL